MKVWYILSVRNVLEIVDGVLSTCDERELDEGGASSLKGEVVELMGELIRELVTEEVDVEVLVRGKVSVSEVSISSEYIIVVSSNNAGTVVT